MLRYTAIAFVMAACVQGVDEAPDVAGLTRPAAPPRAELEPLSALPACPLVCPGEQVVPDGDHMACGAVGGPACAAEPTCGAVWTLVDRLSCDPVRTQDGRAFVGRTNNCMVERPTGTWEACVSHDALPSCVLACAPPAAIACDAESCACTVPSGGTFQCVGAP